jgi:hypothetical protein
MGARLGSSPQQSMTQLGAGPTAGCLGSSSAWRSAPRNGHDGGLRGRAQNRSSSRRWSISPMPSEPRPSGRGAWTLSSHATACPPAGRRDGHRRAYRPALALLAFLGIWSVFQDLRLAIGVAIAWSPVGGRTKRFVPICIERGRRLATHGGESKPPCWGIP